MNMNLFETTEDIEPRPEYLAPGAVVLRGFALPQEAAVLSALQIVVTAAPFRHMITPGGLRMSVGMTNCGVFGWISDRSGYRYDTLDPLTGSPWPAMPEPFSSLATEAAAAAGYRRYLPDACLVNRYQPGAKLSLHQDRNEQDFDQPIVSVSLGMPAVFLFGGMTRSSETRRIHLSHGDVVVWGGEARLRYHGVLPLKEGLHHLVGGYRINLTFRKAR
jgi:DNA oxidative demethylase